MATRVLVTWSLVLVCVWMGVFGFFNKYFDGADLEKARVAKLEIQIRKSERLLAKSQLNFSEYKDVLASQGVKIQDGTKWTDPKREIASVLADSEFKNLPIPQSGTVLFKKAKTIFVSGDYMRASELFENLISGYPDYPNLAEAAYLLEESYFLSDQVDRAINQIDFLVNHFPETEYSAYGLLRLAKLFEKQDRTDEAAEIYEVVVRNFPNSNASSMASKMLSELNQ